jgi:hypothetical protein
MKLTLILNIILINMNDQHFLKVQAEHRHRMLYTLAHQVLPQLLLMPQHSSTEENMWLVEFDPISDEERPAVTLDNISKSGVLELTWQMAWVGSPIEEEPPMDGYFVEHDTVCDLDVFLFTFPKPDRMPDAYFAAAIRSAGRPTRYFTLERSYSSSFPDMEVAALGEWDAQNVHHNHGNYEGEISNKSGFLDAAIKEFNSNYNLK